VFLPSFSPSSFAGLLAFEISYQPAWAWWKLLIGTIAVAVMLVYLYRAQSSIAAPHIILWLTIIRVSLLVLVAILLFRPLLIFHKATKTNETLWVVLDQSLSMAQKDQQATPIEHLRWADALGLMPPETRASKLDRAAARLYTLHDDLLQIQSQNRAGVDENDNARLAKEFIASMKEWGDHFADVTAALEKDPKIQSGDAVSIARDLRGACDQFTAAVAQAADQKSATEAAAMIPWAKTGSAIQAALLKLNPLANQSDAEFLNQHGNDQAVKDALTKVASMRRADVAYQAMTCNFHGVADITPPKLQTNVLGEICFIVGVIGCVVFVWQLLVIIVGMGAASTFRKLGIGVVGLALALVGFIGWGLLSGDKTKDYLENIAAGNLRPRATSMADVMDEQTTRVVTFAGGEQIIATAAKSEIPKAIKAGVEPVGTSTDLNGALKFVNDQISQDEHASVLVVSDGRVNEGGDASIAAQRLASRGIRVFGLGVGSRQIAPDASVDYIDSPEWVYKDDTLKASALVRLDGLSGQPVKIDFFRGKTRIDSHTVTPTDDHITDIETFKDKPPEAGVYAYSVHVQEMPREVVTSNNVQDFRVMVKDDKLHVILVQDQPRWEDRYLANYLKRDNRVQLQQVLVEPAHISDVKPPEPVKASPTNKVDTAQILPATAEEWAAFDFIVIGDVPPSILTTEMQNNIAKAVRDRGTTLLVVAGQLNMPASYAASPLEELLPVHLASAWQVSTLADHLRHGFKVEVAPEGMNSIFSQLDLDEKKNAEYWSAMGSEDNRWYWHSEQTQAKQSASVLWQIGDLHPSHAADSDALTSARQRALLVSMPVGSGRVLYLASPETWRMRQVDGANLHEKFWGQVVRWVVQNDMPAGGKYVRFGSKNKYLAGAPVVVSIRLLKDDFTPRTGEKFKVVARAVKAKDAAIGSVQGGDIIASADAVEIPESPGIYRAVLSGLKPGGIEISLQGATVEKLLADDPVASQKSLLVDILNGTDLELKNINPDHANMARIAQAGNGVASDVIYADILGQCIPDRTHPEVLTERVGLFADPGNPLTRYAHYGFLILFVVLITTEWILRKVGGLV
jgi:hypothetical protein